MSLISRVVETSFRSLACVLLVLCGPGAYATAPVDADPPMSVGILLFEGVQIIDFTGPYEVFGQAGMEVWTASADGEPITTHMGLRVTPTYALDETPRADILVIPGGNVPHVAPDGDPRVSWIRERAGEAEAVLSVCNGVFFLSSAGLLEGQRATTYAPMLDHLEMAAPNVEVVADERVVDNGKVVTAGGLSAGIDGALHLVSRFLGEPRARAVANNMEYDWQPDRAYNRASLADVHIQGVLDFSPPLTRRVDEVYEGSESEWRLRWRVRWPRPVAELQRQFAALAEGAAWQPTNVGDAIDWRDSNWVFKDRAGRTWGSRVEITAAPEGEILLAVEVHLAEGPVPGLDAKPCEPRWTFPVPFYQSVAWSPDGSRLAFAAVTTSWEEGYGIFLVDSDGSNLTRLETGGQPALYPVFSPDGSRIAFTAGRDRDSDVYVLEVDGGEPARLTDHEAADGYPSWSPDGARLAFHSTRDGNYELYVMNADGSGVVRITDHPADDYNPAWSPDGRSIAFDSNRDGAEGDEIYVVSPDGSGLAPVVEKVVEEGVFPTWSPDGKEILFALDGLWAVAADGSGRRRLLEHAVYGAWSPDGSTIAVAAKAYDQDCKDHHSLVLLDPDGTVRKKLLPAE